MVKVIKNEQNLGYPKRIVCESCLSELEYNKDDIEYGAFGCGEITCPVCGDKTDLDDECMELTKDNVEFPKHFYVFNNKGEITEEQKEYIEEKINEAILWFRNYKDEYVYYSEWGDLAIFVFRLTDDKEYNVVVAKGYYETDIPFEEEDY